MDGEEREFIQGCIDDARTALKDAGIYTDHLSNEMDRMMIRERLQFSLKTLENIEDVLRGGDA